MFNKSKYLNNYDYYTNGELSIKEKIQILIEDNIENGGCFFHKKNMKYFSTRIIYEIYGDSTFITSDRPPEEKRRRYTVRYYDWANHRFCNLCEEGEFYNLKDAKEYASENYII